MRKNQIEGERWQRFWVPDVKRECILTEVTDTIARFLESGSDSIVTIHLDRIKNYVRAEDWKYGGMVRCWTLQTL